MYDQIKNYWNPKNLKQLTDIRNIGLYIFTIIVFAITWSGVKTVQNNYELQKQISVLKQQNGVLDLSNYNTNLQNQYFKTDQYLELAARQNFGLAAPGETVQLVPKSVAMKYVDASLSQSSTSSGNSSPDLQKSRFAKNLDDWRNFLLGRRLFE
ncbi:MAG TPA: septum formation initiator family protein [Candidatus Saccharimonadales bacterium]|nr:septum formation initiator family protein [Candidatus Saccharimonadales bacterium]